MTKKEIGVLFIFIAVCLLGGVLAGIATNSSVQTWYVTLQKPSLNPPNKAFPIVWTILYIMMAISAWLIWKAKKNFNNIPLRLFILQYMLNVAWSFIFFGSRSILGGLIDIIALWIAIVATLISFWKISKLASLLLLPYFLWVSFAVYLNFAIWRLNFQDFLPINR